MKLTDSISTIPYVGASYAKKLEKLSIEKVKDLLYHFPKRYEDLSVISKITDLNEEEDRQIKAEVINIKSVRTRNRMSIITGTLRDDSASVDVIWFNQPFISDILKEGEEYLFYGKISTKGKKTVLYSPRYEKVSELANPVNSGAIIPIYRLTDGITQKWLRTRVKYLLTIIKQNDLKLTHPLPGNIAQDENLMQFDRAIMSIHFPKSWDNYYKAKERLAFEEVYKILQIGKAEVAKQSKYNSSSLKAENTQLQNFMKSLPFKLTDSQEKVLGEVLEDIRKDKPTRRLLQGDTGSGKTIIAIASSLVAVQNGVKAVIMAPTSVLANQHFLTFSKFLKGHDVKIELVTGDNKNNDKDADIYIGTHALIHRKGLLSNTGLLIIDEQHRFGVSQRDELLNLELKNNIRPHYINMTATPIPRTLALIIWADFNVSQITEYPMGRQVIDTFVVSKEKRIKSYDWIRKEILDQGNQLFVICPLIDESEKSELKSAKEEFERLSKGPFKDYSLELLHGKVKPNEKDRILEDFKKKKFDVLVSTSVVEVGIDIPDATCILIEGADMFGLAQLHQLRGRVGRNDKKSYCYLLPSDSFDFSDLNSPAYQRLAFFCKNNDGFKLADFDLRSRGPGEVFGTKQSGIPDLQFASLMDIEFINRVKGVMSDEK